MQETPTTIVAGGRAHRVTLIGALDRVGETEQKIRAAWRKFPRSEPPPTLHAFLAATDVTRYEIRAIYGTWRCCVESRP